MIGDMDSGNGPAANGSEVPYRRYFWLLTGAWTCAVGGSLAWNVVEQAEDRQSLTSHAAQALLEKDLLYREWSILHGGVYVPKSEPSDSAALHQDRERDITTPSGQVLTLLNPAVVSRQIFELQNQQTGIRGHIASLNPVRAANAPDAWERQALRAFQDGRQEASSTETIEGQRYFRMMRPLVTIPTCLRCHEEQGRQVGTIRGGISVTVPLSQFATPSENSRLVEAHAGLWLLGMAGLVLGAQNLQRHVRGRRRAEAEREMRTAQLTKEIAERRRTEETLSQLASIVESSADAIIGMNLEGIILSWNTGAAQLYGYSAEEVENRSMAMLLVPERQEELPILLDRIKSGERARHYASVRLTKDGRRLDVSVAVSPIKSAEAKIIGVSLIARDISEHKRAVANIAAALKEKEVLLREIHHRVKNNLQVVCSLLHLQSNLIRDKEALEVFRESEARIKSMALIHEKLYQSENLALVQFDEYVRSLLSMALASYGSRANTLRLEANLQPTSLGMELAIPLGLILNELISNGVRHAFPGGRSGVIAVDLHQRGDHRLALVVRDNGVGLPGNFALETSSSLGLRLVMLLAGQIGGELTYRNNDGAEFTVTCPEQHHV